MNVASKRSFLRALPVESSLVFDESLGGTSTTLSPEATSFWATGRPIPPAPSTAQRRSGKRLAHRSQAIPVGRENLVSDHLAVLVNGRHGIHALVGIDADEHFHAQTSSVRAALRLARGGQSDFEPLWSMPLLGHSTRRTPVGRRPIASQPSLWTAGASRAIPTGILEA